MLKLDEATHTYTMNGRVVPSVTQALSVINNLDQVAFELLERKRIFGVHCHRMVDYFNRGELDESDLDTELARYLFQYKRFLHESRFAVVESESKVFEASLGYAGTFDILALRTRQDWLIDLKSGAVPKTVGPQTAGYQRAHEKRPRRRAYLQLKRDGYQFKELCDPSDFMIFLSALNCYKFKNPRLGNSHGSEENESRSASV